MPNHDTEFLKEALFAVYGPKAAALIVGDAADVLKVGLPGKLDATVHFDEKGLPSKVEVGTHRTVRVHNGHNGGKKNGR